jgi:hypothetical protein
MQRASHEAYVEVVLESRESGGAGAGVSSRSVIALAAKRTHRSAGEDGIRKSLVAES